MDYLGHGALDHGVGAEGGKAEVLIHTVLHQEGACQPGGIGQVAGGPCGDAFLLSVSGDLCRPTAQGNADPAQEFLPGPEGCVLCVGMFHISAVAAAGDDGDVGGSPAAQAGDQGVAGLMVGDALHIGLAPVLFTSVAGALIGLVQVFV